MESFETYRRSLFFLAYRMLGSATDAEDLVQETYLRYQAAPPQTIHSLQAYLTTILTRLCLNQLQLAQRKREVYVGPWLPELILTEGTPEEADPEQRVEIQESISLAFLVLLEQLQPFERAVFLLREVFVYEFAEIAAMLEKSEAACRRSTNGQTISSQATARLSMRGVTHPVILTIKARSNGSVLEAVGSASVLVSEWGIQSPFAVQNDALIEFLVVLHRG